MADTELFKHSTPELYDRYMVPLLFAPFAKVVADRVAQLRPQRVLETAAGTGVLTQMIRDALPSAEIVATDINPAVVGFTADKLGDGATVREANAQELPFEDASFDVVVCQFGVMFFPDKILASREAHRVLQQGGRYLFVTYDRLENNPVPKAADDGVAALFSDDSLSYMERGPFSYTDPARIEADARAGGFTTVDVETVVVTTRVNARDGAYGIVLGGPLRAEIERRDPALLERAVDMVTEALSPFDGQDAAMSAHLVTATA